MGEIDGRGAKGTVEGRGARHGLEGRGAMHGLEGPASRISRRWALVGGRVAPAFVLCLFVVGALSGRASAQDYPKPEDVASPEAIVTAAYRSLDRAPGDSFQWDRFRSLFLPEATLIPNTEQTGGDFRVLSPEGFIEWIDAVVPIGGPDDQGFTEEEVHHVVEQYGDVAHVFSTYQKRFWGGEDVLGRGVNSFQVVRHDGRWWIAGIVWDEEVGAGPIPQKYLD